VDILGRCSRFLSLLLVGITLFEVDLMCLYTHFFGTVPPASCIFLASGGSESAGVPVFLDLVYVFRFMFVAFCAMVLKFLEFHLESKEICLFIHTEDVH
jgi:hypothetical protein